MFSQVWFFFFLPVKELTEAEKPVSHVVAMTTIFGILALAVYSWQIKKKIGNYHQFAIRDNICY